jgi:uncharacterized protein (TIGR03086 family)
MIVDYYTRASAAFGEEVILIGDEEWDLPTPAPEWIIKAIVAHVVVGEAQIPDLVGGNAFEVHEIDVSVLGHDPISVWRGTALAAIEAVHDADLDTLVEHPAGTLPLSQLLGFRITENLVHAWDIATARGVAHELDPEIAAWCLEFWLPMAADLPDSELFGPMVEPSDESAGSRLLGLLGRSG